MAAANFVVITNGGVRAYWNSRYRPMPRAFFPRVAIGCRLSLKIDRNLEGSLSVATWDDTAWIGGTASGTSYRSVIATVSAVFRDRKYWLQLQPSTKRQLAKLLIWPSTQPATLVRICELLVVFLFAIAPNKVCKSLLGLFPQYVVSCSA